MTKCFDVLHKHLIPVNSSKSRYVKIPASATSVSE